MGKADGPNELSAITSIFTSRAAREQCQVPISFHADGKTVAGHSVDLSQSGMLARFEEPLEAWITGNLIIRFNEDLFVVRARVARVDGSQAGLAFRPETQEEHEAVRMLIASLTGLTPTGR